MSASPFWTRLAQLILAVNALFFVVASTMIFLLPDLFQSLVQFMPFNRHYLGDVASFQMAVGLGLLWALPAPTERVAHIPRIAQREEACSEQVLHVPRRCPSLSCQARDVVSCHSYVRRWEAIGAFHLKSLSLF
jgi:hypothetical protein